MTLKKNNPSSAADTTIRIIPLGGLAQVGMNCMVIECNDEAVLIDCGLTFPDADTPGVDLVLPDWSYLDQLGEKLTAILLTHGHEDHIGALPFLLHDVKVPIYGTPLTIGLLRNKLIEHKILHECELNVVETRELVDLTDTLTFEFLHVNHSIPDAAAVVLYTPLGPIIHTGDWRVDHTPIAGKPIDLSSFADLGEEGVLCLLGDSTNVSEPGVSVSESVVMRELERLLAEADGRVLVTMFSSNAYRLQGLLQAAARLKRRVLVNGRSLRNMLDVASELGIIEIPDGVLIDLFEHKSVPDDELLIISTGSQAEPRSSLSRIARDDHRHISLKEGDTVILSARVVPGNEAKVGNLINSLWRKGVEVITKRDAPVHTTGHAYQDELRLMLNLTRPRYFVPVHGEPRMLIKHARLAHSLGFHDTAVLENGEVLEIDADGIRRAGQVPSGRQLVDGTGVGDINDVVLRDRMMLARSGMIVATLVLNAQKGEIVSGPNFLQQGVVDDGDPDETLDDARQYVIERVEDLNSDSLREPAEVAETMRRAVRRFFRQRFQRKPVVIAIVTEV